jgi:hypothetical protein
MQERVALSRSLPTYFAHAEAERGRDCRRFLITLSYLDHGRLDKLQWWWRIGTAEETMLGNEGIEARRQRETERFHRHIERWLSNNRRRLYGDGPFPCLAPMAAAESEASSTAATLSNAAPAHMQPAGKLAHG